MTHKPLNDAWTLWVHLPQDTDWSIASYKDIYTLDTFEKAISMIEYLPEDLIKHCMLFYMRKGVQPIWEDVRNRDGGCFSYRINHKNIVSVWRKLMYLVTGETLLKENDTSSIITGITISPKKNFSVIKVWMSSCDIQDPSMLQTIDDVFIPDGCIFKKHNPEY
jgi:hypothetical protein